MPPRKTRAAAAAAPAAEETPEETPVETPATEDSNKRKAETFDDEEEEPDFAPSAGVCVRAC